MIACLVLLALHAQGGTDAGLPVPVFLGPHAVRRAGIRIPAGNRPDELVFDVRTGCLLALGYTADRSPGADSVSAWDRRGKLIGTWRLPPDVAVSSCSFRWRGSPVVRAGRLLRLHGEEMDYEWVLVTIPTTRSKDLTMLPDTTPDRSFPGAATRLDKAVRRIAKEIDWWPGLPLNQAQSGVEAVRDSMSVSPCWNDRRIAWSPDMSIVVLARLNPSFLTDTCVAVRAPNGTYRRREIGGMLQAAAERSARSGNRARMEIYTVCAANGRIALGVYAGPARRPVVVCLKVGSAGVTVIGTKEGLLASALP